ncbi:MAG: FliI/YscN family ATPase [Subdoligranulum sp.]|nr:FliI/YscN family ATPase [Subdoligranulum sp.]MBD5103102.1 FliI/YscN family ATPase [Subdoligranulum sp.]
MKQADNTARLRRMLRMGNLYSYKGKIRSSVGMTLEATGISCNVGDICEIRMSSGQIVLAEVIGIRDEITVLMPYQDVDGIGAGSVVTNTGQKLTISLSDALIGRTIDALGNPIDGGPPLPEGVRYSINGNHSNPMDRPPISQVIEMGVRVIDGMLTIGKGQRMGIFAGSGVGKSTLMGMIARNIKADVNVIALVGERGREVVEFMNKDLGPEGLQRTVLVVATSDQSSMMRSKCALTATTIAEYFRDQGKDVLLMMDSLTRYCMAQREIGLSTGELPVARGYTPSIYAVLPKLLERSGNFERGSITGIYTVLVEGDDTNEPISDTVRGIVDGHIILSRKIAMRNHYPAIDVLASVSRLMSVIASPEHNDAAGKIRNMLAVYEENQDLLSIGAYKAGSNPRLDEALRHMDAINALLQQPVGVKSEFDETLAQMVKIVS